MFFFQIHSFPELSEMRLPPSYEESFMNDQSHLIGIRKVTLNASKFNTIKYLMLKMRKNGSLRIICDTFGHFSDPHVTFYI